MSNELATLLARLREAELSGDEAAAAEARAELVRATEEAEPFDIEKYMALPPGYELFRPTLDFGEERACVAVNKILLAEVKGNVIPVACPVIVLSTGHEVRTRKGIAVQADAPTGVYFWPEPGLAALPPARWPDPWRTWFCEDAKRHGDGMLKYGHSAYTAWEAIREKALEYIEFPGDYWAGVLALWIMGTYLHPLFDTYPYLHFNGKRQSGKSKCLRFISALAFNAMYAVNISPPALFRFVELSRGTVLVDEAENLQTPTETNQAILQLLHAGYKRGATAARCKPQTHEVITFLVYSPKALASIEEIWGILRDRVIPINMQRSKAPQASRTLPPEEAFGELRATLYALALSDFRLVRLIYNSPDNTLPEGCAGRMAELWRPLFTLARWVAQEQEGELDPLADVEAAWRVFQPEYELGALSPAEIAVVMACLQALGVDAIKEVPCNVITQHAVARLDPRSEEQLDNQRVGYLMRRLGLYLKRRRRRQGIAYLLSRERVRLACERYDIPVEELEPAPTWLPYSEEDADETEDR